MSDEELRRIVVEALADANVFAFRELGIASAFVAGDADADAAFDDLEMDSLAEMELCIAIEVNTGISILPEQLRQIRTVGGLVEAIRRG